MRNRKCMRNRFKNIWLKFYNIKYINNINKIIKQKQKYVIRKNKLIILCDFDFYKTILIYLNLLFQNLLCI